MSHKDRIGHVTVLFAKHMVFARRNHLGTVHQEEN